MDITTIVVMDEAAEDLLNYLVAYRNLRGSLDFDLENKTPMEDNTTIGIIPREELLVFSK